MILFKLIFSFLFFVFPLFAQNHFQEQILDVKNKVLPALVHIQPVKEIFASGKRVKVKVTGSGIIFSP
ncbi:MAG: hypothetical protein KAS18_07945, partial [Calditrichia bacterium]|nr:hypothetical protein [Calditrichia bacterium]